MPTGLKGWKDYVENIPPWCNDPERVRIFMAATFHNDQVGNEDLANVFLIKALSAENTYRDLVNGEKP